MPPTRMEVDQQTSVTMYEFVVITGEVFSCRRRCNDRSCNSVLPTLTKSILAFRELMGGTSVVDEFELMTFSPATVQRMFLETEQAEFDAAREAGRRQILDEIDVIDDSERIIEIVDADDYLYTRMRKCLSDLQRDVLAIGLASRRRLVARCLADPAATVLGISRAKFFRVLNQATGLLSAGKHDWL